MKESRRAIRALNRLSSHSRFAIADRPCPKSSKLCSRHFPDAALISHSAMGSSLHRFYTPTVTLRTRANLARPVAVVVVGCLLAAWLSASAPAQVVGATAPTDSASASGSHLNTEKAPNQSNATGVDTAVNVVDRSVELAPDAAQARSRELAQQYANEKLVLWQQRLQLGDWRITWTMAHRCDLKPNTVGQIHWDRARKSATILVLDSSDYKMPFNAMLDDMEMTIIHELVHLKLTPLPHSEASRGGEEQAVDGISEALFALEHHEN